ncbi:hypothetical protein HPB50_026315 [Hyalomma asiaticum]|uniref:Uncharacterized protein n=1 Tax=Hyalomma asiaticum TaxID=266040 RepID=A0ACB7SZS3_HYAAI|nr:hypothetical protein HPB50_026315 [Hyalomma asiaticum]
MLNELSSLFNRAVRLAEAADEALPPVASLTAQRETVNDRLKPIRRCSTETLNVGRIDKACSLSEAGGADFSCHSSKGPEDASRGHAISRLSTWSQTPEQRRPIGPPGKQAPTEVSDDESTVIGEDNVADMEDVDEDAFKVVRHRKGRTVGVTVLITATEQGRDLRQGNPITLYS